MAAAAHTIPGHQNPHCQPSADTRAAVATNERPSTRLWLIDHSP